MLWTVPEMVACVIRWGLGKRTGRVGQALEVAEGPRL